MRNPMGLSVTDLSCSRGGRPVLDGVSFALADGETLVLRGPNGAGKSTLLRALAGLLPATGCIKLDGRPSDRDTRSEAVAYAGHLDAIKPQLTVAENLAFWAALFDADPAPALAAFDLAPIVDRPAHLCSAGQKRRLGLARLLVAPRRLWLLDEPTVSLVAAATDRLLAAVRGHAAEGGLAVIATHAPLDLAPAQTLTLAPEGRGARSTDPFLAGAWT
jgi:heme exporter protein A